MEHSTITGTNSKKEFRYERKLLPRDGVRFSCNRTMSANSVRRSAHACIEIDRSGRTHPNVRRHAVRLALYKLPPSL
jgi:hypothetical protein